jgi:uncharacterized protein YuzE
VEKILKIEESTTTGRWSYDGEADVLDLSPAEPRPADGVDIGGGVIVRFDEDDGEVVGVTIVGLRERLLQELKDEE